MVNKVAHGLCASDGPIFVKIQAVKVIDGAVAG